MRFEINKIKYLNQNNQGRMLASRETDDSNFVFLHERETNAVSLISPHLHHPAAYSDDNISIKQHQEILRDLMSSSD